MALVSASAMALPLPAVRATVARPAPAAPLRLRLARARLVLAAHAPPRSSVSVVCAKHTPCVAPLRLRLARARLVLAAHAPPRSSVSVRCAPENNGNYVAGGNPGPGGVHGPAVDAVKSAAAAAFRPLLDNFCHICSLKNVWDVNDYHIGMPFGVLLAGVGCYRLFKTDPRTFLDVVVGYALYKLSVLSSEVDRRGFANDFITRIKVAIAFGMFLAFPRDHSHVLGIIRMEVTVLYLATFLFDIRGWKQDARSDLSEVWRLVFKKN